MREEELRLTQFQRTLLLLLAGALATSILLLYAVAGTLASRAISSKAEIGLERAVVSTFNPLKRSDEMLFSLR